MCTMLIAFLIVALLCIILVICNKAYKKTNGYKNRLDFENSIADPTAVPYDLEVVNTGSVFGRFAYEYCKLQRKGFNFAMSPQSLAYDFRILKQFKDHMKKGCVVFITLPVCIFAFVDYDYKKYARYNNKYYSFMDKNNMVNYNPVVKFLYRHIPVLFAKKEVLCIFKDEERNNPFDIKNGVLSENLAERQAEEQLTIWKKQFDIADFTNPVFPESVKDSMQTTTELLYEMITFCRDCNWKPVLVTPPTSKLLRQRFSKEFLNAFFYEHISQANDTDIPYLNFLDHPSFQEQYDFFINGISFLSRTGRDRFMRLLTTELEKLEFL